MLTEFPRSGMHRGTAIETLHYVRSRSKVKVAFVNNSDFRISPQITNF